VGTLIDFRASTVVRGEHRTATNLDVRLGETLTIIGGSGQGRACLKLMIGLMQAGQARVLYYGEDVGEMSAEYSRSNACRWCFRAVHCSTDDDLKNVGWRCAHTKMGTPVRSAMESPVCWARVDTHPRYWNKCRPRCPWACANSGAGPLDAPSRLSSTMSRPPVSISNCNRIARMIRSSSANSGDEHRRTHDMTTAWYGRSRGDAARQEVPVCRGRRAFAPSNPIVRDFIREDI
jgi:phospholipid/cholesterol/gamma-HCH transport system ATP-binding protein